jgi:hypothetical protein
MGFKGVACGPDGIQLADNYTLTKLMKCHSFLPSPIHACPCCGPWATSKTCKGMKRVPDALTGTSQLRQTTLTENISPPGSVWAGHGADTNTPEKKVCQEIWGSKNQTALLLKDLAMGGWSLSRYKNTRVKNWKNATLETNGHGFLRTSWPTSGCRANADDY